MIENASFYDRCTALLDGEVFPEALVQKIQSEYDILLRGKTLFDLLLRQISHSSREIKHSRKSIMEFMASMRGPKMNDIFTKVGSNIS